MSIFERVVEFLPAGTWLMIPVRPSGDFDEYLLAEAVSTLHTEPSKRGPFIPIRLEQDQFITFSISNQGQIQKKLKPCFCTTPVMRQKILKSINDAGQSISGLFEKERASKGGTVYDNIYFLDRDNIWRPLKILRERIYEIHYDDFRRYLVIHGSGIGPYLRLHPDSTNFLVNEIDQRDNLLTDLRLQNENLEEQLKYFNNLFQQSKIHVYQNKLREFRERLSKTIPETKGPDSWQDWIYQNNWLFGVQYSKPIEKARVGFDSIPDFLFPTADDFIDILEIKLPDAPVLIEDRSHTGSYKWSDKANEAIAQADHYVTEINSHHLEVSRRIKDEYGLEVNAIKPRAIVLIGKSDLWNNRQRERFRSLNHLLHGVEVITYTDLLKRGENLIKLYTD